MNKEAYLIVLFRDVLQVILNSSCSNLSSIVCPCYSAPLNSAAWAPDAEAPQALPCLCPHMPHPRTHGLHTLSSCPSVVMACPLFQPHDLCLDILKQPWHWWALPPTLPASNPLATLQPEWSSDKKIQLCYILLESPCMAPHSPQHIVWTCQHNTKGLSCLPPTYYCDFKKCATHKRTHTCMHLFI